MRTPKEEQEFLKELKAELKVCGCRQHVRLGKKIDNRLRNRFVLRIPVGDYFWNSALDKAISKAGNCAHCKNFPCCNHIDVKDLKELKRK